MPDSIVGIVPPQRARVDYVDYAVLGVAAWSRTLRQAGFTPNVLRLHASADLPRLWDCRAVFSLGAGIYPELSGALVATAIAQWVRQGGIWVEIAGHFFLFGCTGSRVTVPGQLAADMFDLGVDMVLGMASLRTTPAGRAILGALDPPATVLAANPTSNFRLMVFPTIDPWLSLVETDRGDSLLSVNQCGKGYIVRWGSAAHRCTRRFLAVALVRIVRYLLDGQFCASVPGTLQLVIDPLLIARERCVALQTAVVNTSSAPYPDSCLDVVMHSSSESAVGHATVGTIAARSAHVQVLTLDMCPREPVDVGAVLAGPQITRGQAVAELPRRPGICSEHIPPPRRPADFAQFWRRARTELGGVKRDEEWCWLPEASTAQVVTRRVRFRSLGGIHIGGFFSYPAQAASPVPGVLMLPGYNGMDQFPSCSAASGFAVLGIDVRGVGISAEDFPFEGDGLLTRGLLSPEHHAYRGAFMDCLRALDVLVAQPMVDPNRLSVQGISQGGGLALAVAALNRRVSTVVAEVPFLCDITRSASVVDSEPLAELNRWFSVHPEDGEAAISTLAYFDAANFVVDLRAATLLVYSPDDQICPESSIETTRARMQCPLTVWRRRGGHSYPFLTHHRRSVTRWLLKSMTEQQRV